MSRALSPESQRAVRRLALAAGLVVITGLARGLDAAMAVGLSLVVMEVDAQRP